MFLVVDEINARITMCECRNPMENKSLIATDAVYSSYKNDSGLII